MATNRKTQAKKKTAKKDIVLIRTYSAGVHVGTLASYKGKEVKLTNARRVWQWVGANSLSELSVTGPQKGSRISEPVEWIVLTEAIEIIPVTDEANAAFNTIGWSA